ncbi:MAG: cysteine hydrolase [Acidobacteria bacterium]|nr:MAG: cysteine hydrolase [Acidobacteriota bacterium]
MRHLSLPLLIAAVAAVAGYAQTQGKAPVGPETALLVIDIQNFYFEGGSVPLTGSVEAARQARRVLDAFRAGKLPVVHIRHAAKTTVFVDGEPTDAQYKIHGEVAPVAGEKVVTKHYANSFRETELLENLRAQKITSVVLVGMQTHMCVEAAARAATDLGFAVTVIPEACATRPLSYGGVKVPAEMVHATALAAINGTYGRVVGIDAWLVGR